MPEQALRLANHIPHPEVVAIAFLVVAVILFVLSLRARRTFTGAFAALALNAIGLAPLAINHVLQARGVYHVQVELRGPDGAPVPYAQLKSSVGGEMKIFEGGWRLDIPRQNRPPDGRIAFFAGVKEEFLKGSSTLTLADDYYPSVTIPLAADTSAKIRGVVVDQNMVAVAGASVTVVGYPEVTTTDSKGNFILPAHAGKGQTVELRAQKEGSFAHLNAPAGKVAEVILNSE